MAAAIVLAAVAAGCSPDRPEKVEIFVATVPPGAACTLIRAGQPIATVDPTPGIALVLPGPEDIAVNCSRTGFAPAVATVHSRKPEQSFGTLLRGGPNETYDGSITLPLTPRSAPWR